MPYYTNEDDDVDDFTQYDPMPYSGGYDITVTYGRSIPPCDETCYPLSSRSGDSFEYQRPVFSTNHDPAPYADQALKSEYSSYDKPKPKPVGGSGSDFGRNPCSGITEVEFGRKTESDHGSGYGRRNEEDGDYKKHSGKDYGGDDEKSKKEKKKDKDKKKDGYNSGDDDKKMKKKGDNYKKDHHDDGDYDDKKKKESYKKDHHDDDYDDKKKKKEHHDYDDEKHKKDKKKDHHEYDDDKKKKKDHHDYDDDKKKKKDHHDYDDDKKKKKDHYHSDDDEKKKKKKDHYKGHRKDDD